MTRRIRGLAMTLAALVAVAGWVVWNAHRPSKGHASALVPTDTTLRRDWLYFYPSHEPGTPKGFVALFGNDIAFWGPHQDLGWRLADDGYSVVGIDVRKFLATLPTNEPQRDSAFGVAMPDLIARTRHALNADTLPVIVGGHSYGAELAFWIAAYRPPAHLVGVLSLNTRSTSHLFITAGDWLNEEASGPWTFSTIDAVRRMDPTIRVALLRGGHDPFRRHDPEFVAAGGARVRRFEIPMAGHALSTMLLAGPIVSRAVRFLSDTARR